jgi:Ca2+-binding EF-hand superfamily protein
MSNNNQLPPIETKSITVKKEDEKTISISKSILDAIKSFVGKNSHDKFFQKPVRLSEDLSLKIRRCFIKLNKILNDRRLTLYKMFNAYDPKRKGFLGLKELTQILRKLDGELSDE